MCEQLAQGCYLLADRLGVEPTTALSQVPRPSHYASKPPTTTRWRLNLFAQKDILRRPLAASKAFDVAAYQRRRRPTIGRSRSVRIRTLCRPSLRTFYTLQFTLATPTPGN